MNNKLLHHYEQSLLLIAMLFFQKHLEELLALFPEDQIHRITAAKDRFLRLDKSERITQIILELKRLLLTEENTTALIHESWIIDQLSKEPAYLRTLLGEALSNKTPRVQKRSLEHSLLRQSFLPSILNSPPKIALFDPVLMRLQATNEKNLSKLLSAIGAFSLENIAHCLKTTRFKKFMEKRLPSLSLDREIPKINNNPFHYAPIRELILKRIVHHKTDNFLDDLGLFMIAMYLSFHKVRWQRAIELALPKALGLKLRLKIAEIDNKLVVPEQRAPLASLLILSMDEAFN